MPRELESRVRAAVEQHLALGLGDRLTSFVAGRLPEARAASEAGDIAHDVWVRFLRRPPGRRPAELPAAWAYLRTAATRALIDRHRRARVRSGDRSLADAGTEQPTDTGLEPIACMMLEEERAVVRRAIAQLDGRTALAVSLRVGDGLSYASIVERCGFRSAAEARRTVRRGVQRLSRRLSGRAASVFVDRVRA